MRRRYAPAWGIIVSTVVGAECDELKNSDKAPRRARRTRIAIAGVLTNLVLVSGLAAESTSIGVFRHWTALTFDEQGGIACMMWSQPREARGEIADRGEVFVFVTHRPATKRFNAVTLDSGYPLKIASTVKVTIEGKAFDLSTDGSNAWTQTEEDDARLVEAMRAGLTMVVEGTSQAGQHTRDTFSLRGFSAAHDAISTACKKG